MDRADLGSATTRVVERPLNILGPSGGEAGDSSHGGSSVFTAGYALQGGLVRPSDRGATLIRTVSTRLPLQRDREECVHSQMHAIENSGSADSGGEAEGGGGTGLGPVHSGLYIRLPHRGKQRTLIQHVQRLR